MSSAFALTNNASEIVVPSLQNCRFEAVESSFLGKKQGERSFL
jgi:hypothetical protein